MIDRSELQGKIDRLPYAVRWCIRGGLIFITWLPIFLPDLIGLSLILGHLCIVGVLLHYHLDLRPEPDQTWEEYQKSLHLELFLCVIFIIVVVII